MSFGIPVRNGLAIGLLSSTFLSTRRALPPATFSLNFLAGAPLDPSVTFTRSTTATFVGSNGLIQSSAINTPRFNYDPVTLAPQGLIIEGQRTNLLLNSDILGTNLSTQNVTVTAQSYTISFYGTGTITLSGVAIQTVTGTGAYPSRRTLTFTPTAGVLICTVTGTVQFAQLEAGTFATSFIPTAASTVTREPDVAVVNTLTPWFNSSQSTLYAEWTNIAPAIPSGVTQTICQIGEASLANFYVIFQSQGAGAKASTNMFSGGVNAGRMDSGGAYSNATVKAASAFAALDRAISANGTVPTTSSSGNLPVGVTTLTLGHQIGSANFFNGYFRVFKYYPLRLTNAQLQALSS